MNALIAKLRGLWSREPVLVGTVLPALVSVGFVTAGQADAVSHAFAAAAAAVSAAAGLFGAFRARAVVKSPATQAAEAAALRRVVTTVNIPDPETKPPSIA